MFRKCLFILITLSATGCSSSFIKYEAPLTADNLADVRMEVGGLTDTRISSNEPVAEWWEEFDDPMLSKLVEEALLNNKSIDIAVANLQASRALAREFSQDKYPSVQLNGGYMRERPSAESEVTNTGNSFNSYSIGFDAMWELDLFDRVSNRVEASHNETEAVEEDLKNVQISIAAEVAKTYIELRGAQSRLVIAERNLSLQRQTLELTRTLTEGGIGNNLDIMQAETQLAMTQADVSHRKSNVVAAINRLTVLTGKHPDSLHQELVKTQPLPSLPISVKVGNVSELMKNRPDIKAAERRLAAATAKYNVAVADQFPSVNIVGGLGFIATNLANLGTSSAITAAIGPSMSWGVFDMGRIRSRIEQNDSISKAALANYELAVMEALEETRTAVHDFAREEERREHLKKAASSSIQATVIAKQRFTLGDTDFLPVLDSERTRLSAEDALAVSEIQSAVNLVRIYKAIGRGWKHTGEDGTS